MSKKINTEKHVLFSKNRRQFLAVGGFLSLIPYLGLSAESSNCGQHKLHGRWQTANTQLTPFLVDNKQLYAVGESTIECWNTQAGERIWQRKLDYPAVFRPRLLADLVITSGRSQIDAWNRVDGKIVWSHRVKKAVGVKRKTELGVPLLHQSCLYFGQGSTLKAIDAQTGKPLWSFETTKNSRIAYAPTAKNNTLYLGSGDGVLYALSCKTGEMLWSVDREKDWQYLRQLAVSDNTLVCGGYHDEIFGLNRKNGKINWRFNAGNFINSQLVHKGSIYFWSPTGWLYALNADTGRVHWRTLTTDYRNISSKTNWAPVMAEVVADDNVLIVLAMDNVLHTLDLKTGKELQTSCIKSNLRSFVVQDNSNNKIYLASSTGEIISL